MSVHPSVSRPPRITSPSDSPHTGATFIQWKEGSQLTGSGSKMTVKIDLSIGVNWESGQFLDLMLLLHCGDRKSDIFHFFNGQKD